MALLYLDTSALLKIIIQEDESGRVLEAAQEIGRICSSLITYAESHATISRLYLGASKGNGEANFSDYQIVVEDFAALWADTNVIGVTQEIAEIAAQITVSHPGLRGMDALHLASASFVSRQEEVFFLTFDDRLYGAAEAILGKGMMR